MSNIEPPEIKKTLGTRFVYRRMRFITDISIDITAWWVPQIKWDKWNIVEFILYFVAGGEGILLFISPFLTYELIILFVPFASLYLCRNRKQKFSSYENHLCMQKDIFPAEHLHIKIILKV